MGHAQLPRVLLLSSGLTAGLAEGGRFALRAITCTVEDLDYLLDDKTLPLAVVELLQKARHTLASSKDATTVSPELHRALVPLSEAIARLADPPIPSTLTLPLELIAHIINFAQTGDDYGLRQATNMALSRVSRDVYRIVRPILRREIHITEGWQFRGLEKVRKEDRDRALEVKLVTMKLVPSQLRRTPKVWFGKLVVPVSGWLFLWMGRAGGRTEVVLLDASTQEERDAGRALDHALGEEGLSLSGGAWAYAPNLFKVSLHYQYDMKEENERAAEFYRAIFLTEHLPRSLSIWCTKPRPASRNYFRVQGHLVRITPRDFECLQIPQAALFPTDLLALLPQENDLISLHTLAITLVFPIGSFLPGRGDEEYRAFSALAARLGPTLKHLELRIRNQDDGRSSNHLVDSIIETLRTSFVNLESLAFGGTGLAEPDEGFVAALAQIPSRELRILATADERVRNAPRRPQLEDDPMDHQAPALDFVRMVQWKRGFRLQLFLAGKFSPNSELDEVCTKRGIELDLVESTDSDWMNHHDF